jgi:hypothetical protein
MKNHPLYKAFKKKVEDKGLSIEGIRLLDARTIKGELGNDIHLPAALFRNMKSYLIFEMQEQQDEIDKQAFASKVEVLRNKWPDLKVERGREGDKPFVIIWLKGKPDAPDMG